MEVHTTDVNGASPRSATRFGWQFPRNRPQLPDFERGTSEPERSRPPLRRPTGRNVGSGVPSHKSIQVCPSK
jgi:hypothetical protein